MGRLTMDMDERIERTLRSQAPDDPPHRVGAYRDRLDLDLRRPRVVVRARVGRASPALGLALLALALVALLALVPLLLLGGQRSESVPSSERPSSSPVASPSPSSTPRATIAPSRLQAALEAWAAASRARVTVSIVGPTGDVWDGSSGGGVGSAPDPTAAVRIGETSSVFVVSAILSLDECRRTVAVVDCGVEANGPLFLDDRLDRWLPGWPGGAAITVRMLLEGTSGLPATGPTIADLLAPAAPPGGWTRAALLKRARARPMRFAPGTSFGPIDTEALLLDEIVAKVTGQSSATWTRRATIDHIGLRSTFPGTPPRDLETGTSTGGPVADLPADLLGALGTAGGVAANAPDLATLATYSWGITSLHDPVSVAAATAITGPARWSLGAAGWCPCPGGTPQVVGRSGRAGAWSALAAYDLAGRVALGITVDREVSDDQLAALVEALVGTTR